MLCGRGWPQTCADECGLSKIPTLIRPNPSATRQAWTRRAANFTGTIMRMLPTMLMSIMIIAIVAMIYAVRLAGRSAIVLAFVLASRVVGPEIIEQLHRRVV